MLSLRSPRFILATFAASLALAACGGASSSTPTTSPAAGASDKAAHGDPSCPVAVPGTSVTVEDTDTGAALVFVTTGDVADLRRRVGAMAQMHNDAHGKMGPLPTGEESGDVHGGAHAGHGGGPAPAGGAHAGMNHGAGGMNHGAGGMGQGAGGHAGHAGGMISVHSRAEASDVDGGARLALVVGGADVGKLQAELRMHAQHFASGSCAMGAMGTP